MESTTILRISRLANRLWLHNIFIHVPHHVDTRIRFDQLPNAAAAIVAAYPHTVRSSRLSIASYLLVTAATLISLVEVATRGVPAVWDKAEGTR